MKPFPDPVHECQVMRAYILGIKIKAFSTKSEYSVKLIEYSVKFSDFKYNLLKFSKYYCVEDFFHKDSEARKFLVC